MKKSKYQTSSLKKKLLITHFIAFFLFLFLFFLLFKSAFAYTAYDIGHWPLDTAVIENGLKRTLENIRNQTSSEYNLYPFPGYNDWDILGWSITEGSAPHENAARAEGFYVGGFPGNLAFRIPIIASLEPVSPYSLNHGLTAGIWFRDDRYNVLNDEGVYLFSLKLKNDIQGGHTYINVFYNTLQKKIFVDGLASCFSYDYDLNNSWNHIAIRITTGRDVELLVNGQKVVGGSLIVENINDYSFVAVSIGAHYAARITHYYTLWSPTPVFFDDLFITGRHLADWQVMSIVSSLNPYDGLFYLPPPPLPPPPDYYEFSTSTIFFDYSDYTTRWENPTKFLADISEILGKIANPILAWTEGIKENFSKTAAEANGKLMAEKLRTVIASTSIFKVILGNFHEENFNLILFLFSFLFVLIFINLIVKVFLILKP